MKVNLFISLAFFGAIQSVVAAPVLNGDAAIVARDTEDFNTTLVERGGGQSKPVPEDYFTPLEDIRKAIRKKGNVGKKVSGFYTMLGSAKGQDKAKKWVADHPDMIPAKPGAVFFDSIVDQKFMDKEGAKLLGLKKGQARLDAFQKMLSQYMAEESAGTAWIFAPKDINFASMQKDPKFASNAWVHWEYPALTRNAKIDKIIRVDPDDTSKKPTTTQIWKKGDPTQAPKGLVKTW